MKEKRLKKWFLETKRDFPWRREKTPYRVWVSEVMLQQTVAKAVIPYFERWMKTFPDIESLAKADELEVLKLWEGLGYYSRAKRLHQGAKQIVKDHKSKLPETLEELQKLEGLGDYTSAAILCFGFHKKAAAVDGNVMRVVSRLLRIKCNITQARTKKLIKEYVFDKLPEKEPHITMEAFIELGATVCRPFPNCGKCPLRLDCQAFANKDPEKFPIKPKREQPKRIEREVFVFLCRNHILVKIEEDKKKVMGHLVEFPYKEKEDKSPIWTCLLKHSEKTYLPLKPVTQTFTRYRAKLTANLYRVNVMPNYKGLKWLSLEELKLYPFSSGHRKILQQLNL